jgi:hypothetical protein
LLLSFQPKPVKRRFHSTTKHNNDLPNTSLESGRRAVFRTCMQL